MLVIESKTLNTAQEQMLEFEILSFVPLDRKLINKEMLTEEEISWVNEYHRITRKKIANHLDMETKKWFIRTTSNI